MVFLSVSDTSVQILGTLFMDTLHPKSNTARAGGSASAQRVLRRAQSSVSTYSRHWAKRCIRWRCFTFEISACISD